MNQMTMQLLWLCGAVGAISFNARFEDLFLKARPRWKKPQGNIIEGPVSVWKEGWVSPGSRVSIDDHQLWVNDDFAWRTATLPKASKAGTRHHCRRVEATKECSIECYFKEYTGFYWGKARKVSQQQTCPTRLCVFSPSSQDVISYETSPSMGWTAAFLFELIGPSHPTPLKIASRFNSSENYSMVSKGPVKGHVWFKPLFWAMSGWYSKSTARENDSFVQSFQLEVRFPLAFIDVAEGAFSFVPSTKEN
ncbi:hypothetical protein DSO57_1032488 [Entomophthora muscae]|uniref:Uncharacterized protein n=1 Tax=Entomophthora muscae TaxID=34485 RepID=A0ACC2U9D9_9FUNG|nr:hypothetical protein DSO57_1032488 [Entomophthora muscae]